MRMVPMLMLAAVALLSARGAAATAPPAFHLVFDGAHNAQLLHEGTFTTSYPLCPSGQAVDTGVDATTDTAVRQFTCAGGGEFTAKVRPLPAEHGGSGSWQIVAGSGPLANLRGKGTFTSTGSRDPTIRRRSRSGAPGTASPTSTPPHRPSAS